MLVLHRKPGQRVVITSHNGAPIVVTVLGRGGAVKLGIEAPAGVRIDREEIFRRRAAPGTKKPATGGQAADAAATDEAA